MCRVAGAVVDIVGGVDDERRRDIDVRLEAEVARYAVPGAEAELEDVRAAAIDVAVGVLLTAAA